VNLDDVNLNHTVFPNDNTTEKIEGNTLNEKNRRHFKKKNIYIYIHIYIYIYIQTFK